MWFATFVLFDSIKFELICTFDKHAVHFMMSAPVAEHQLFVSVVVQPRTIFRPLRKKFSSQDERQVAKKKYDQESRERKFLPQWTKDRSWLDYDGDKQLMFCATKCALRNLTDKLSKSFCFSFNKHWAAVDSVGSVGIDFERYLD
jgi:hypothetical protein